MSANVQAMDIERPLAQEIVKRLNHMFGESNYHTDQALLALLDERGYVLLEQLVQVDARLRELTGGRASMVKAALQIVPSTVLQVSRDKKFIRRVTSEVRIVRFLDNIFKDLSHPNNSDLQSVAEGANGYIWIATIFDRRPEFAQMAWGNVRHVVSACVRGRPRYTHLCEDKLRVRRKNLRERVASQIEYYFSEENLPYDKHLRALIDDRGAVPVHDLMNFPALRQLSQDPMMVLEALKDSTSVEASLCLPDKSAGAPSKSQPPVDLASSVTVRLIPRQRQIIHALEYLFSDAYLSQERFLQRVLEESARGFVSFSMLLSFNRIAELQCTLDEMVKAAQQSSQLEVSDDLTMARPKNFKRTGYRPTRPSQLDLRKAAPGTDEDFPLPSPNTHVQIVALLEYYFGDENFPLDRHLQSLAVDEPVVADASSSQGLHRKGPSSDRLVYGGWVPLTELIKFQRLKLLRVTLADVRSAVGAHAQTHSQTCSLILSGDGMYMRRKNPLPPCAPIIGPDGIQPEIFFKEGHNNRAFTVMQYNVLSDNLCREDWFPYTTEEVRSWQYRRKLIQKQIRYRRPDLLCLEEVQSVSNFGQISLKMPKEQALPSDSQPPEGDNHAAWFAEWLTNDGYEIHYCRKETRQSDIPENETGHIQIGNLLAWNCNEFEFIEAKDVVLSKEIQNAINMYHQRNRDLMTPGRLDRMVKRSVVFLAYSSTQVASFVRLRHKATNQQVAFCGIHVTANYRAPYLQLIQVQVCLEEIERFTSPRACPPNMRGMPPEPIPVVLCGDFNSTPEQGVISLLSAGKLPANHIDMERAYELGIVFPHQLQHSLGLLSTHHWAARHAGGMINGLPICEQRFTQSQQKFQRQLMAQQQQQHQQQILAMQQAGIIPAPGSAQGVVPPHFNQQQAQLALATMVILAKTSKLQQSSSQAASDSEDANEKSDGGLSSGTEKLSLSERESTPITIPGRQPALNGESPLLSNSASRSPLSSSPALASSSPSARPTPAVAVQVSPLQRQDNGSSTSQQPSSSPQQQARQLTLDLKNISANPQGRRSHHGSESSHSSSGSGGEDTLFASGGLAYAASPCSPGIPQLPITNYTHLFSGCLDYIWVTPQRGLQIEGALGGIPLSLLAEYTGLPSPRYPSDHLPVLARLSFPK